MKSGKFPVTHLLTVCFSPKLETSLSCTELLLQAVFAM